MRKQEAHEVFEQCLLEYGKHSLKSKLPHILDGLKPVQRRILLAHHSSDMPKVVSITGKVLDLYHPYGDNSISNTIIRMAKPFNIFVTLMYSPSNVGDYGGGEAAAPRYLEICASEIARYVYFNNVDQSIFQMIPTEVGNGLEEPKFMVPRIPMGLIVSGFGIAFGYSSEPGNHCLGDVCKAVVKYNKLKVSGKGSRDKNYLYKHLAKYLVPDFPTYQLIRNWDTLIAQYKKANYSTEIWIDGLLEIHPNKIIIRNLPFGVGPRDVWDKLGKARGSNKPNFVNTNFSRIEDYSNSLEYCDIIVTLKRGVDVFEVLEEFKTFIGFSKRWKPRYLFTLPNGKVDYVDPVKMLEYWYEERTRCVKAELSSGQHKLVREMRVWEALIKIGDNIKDVVDILLNAKSQEKAIPVLCKKYKLNKTQAFSILNYKLSNIPKQAHADLVKQRKDAVDKLNLIQTRFLNTAKTLEQDCLDTVAKFPKYSKRNSNPPKFMGACIFDNGIIQFNSIKEMTGLIESFGYVNDVVIYPSGKLHKLRFKGEGMSTESTLAFPKEMEGSGLIVGNTLPTYTIALSSTGRICRSNTIEKVLSKKVTAEYVGSVFTGIDGTGLIRFMKASEIPIGDNLKKPIKESNIIRVGCNIENTVLVVYSKRVDEIIIEKRLIGDTIPLTTRTTVLGIYTHGVAISLKIPDRCCSNSTKVRHLMTRGTGAIDNMTINISKNKSKVCYVYDQSVMFLL